jgi:molecular chaperone HscB
MNDVHHATESEAKAGLPGCWACARQLGEDALFCESCRAIQAPLPIDHFRRLGLAAGFALDAKALDAGYFSRQRLLHPDRFATRSARERAISQSQAVALNEAYETLKDPLARANYLLRLHGVDANPDGCHTINDPTLLTEQLECREALMDADSVAAVDALIEQSRRHAQDCLSLIAGAFEVHDLDVAGRETTRLKYLLKFQDEARARRGQLARAA